MIKIIGQDDKHIHKITCYKCASILEYTLADTKEVSYHDYTGSRELVEVIICPKCGKEIRV